MRGGSETFRDSERSVKQKKFDENLKFWLRLAGTAVLLKTITFGAAAIAYLFKIYPALETMVKSTP